MPSEEEKITVLVEIKPGMSNDYPDILRQMRAQRHSYCILTKQENKKIVQVLAIGNYTGDTDYEVVDKMFGDIKIRFPFSS